MSFKKIKLFFAESSSLITIIFVIGALLILALSISDGLIDSDEVGNVLTFLLAFSAFLSLQASNASINKKLQIEQQPLVVISLPENLEESPSPLPGRLTAKNIGRGPALGIRVNSARFQTTKPIFDSSQPESVDLAAGEIKEDWSLDQKTLAELLGEKQQFNLFISFTDQMGNIYEMRTDMKFANGYWRVSENVRII